MELNMSKQPGEKGGFVANYAHIATWIISCICLFAALWVKVNFPSRDEWKETTKQILDRIDLLVREANANGMQLAIVKERQDAQTIRIIDMDKRLKTIEIHFPAQIPKPGEP